MRTLMLFVFAVTTSLGSRGAQACPPPDPGIRAVLPSDGRWLPANGALFVNYTVEAPTGFVTQGAVAGGPDLEFRPYGAGFSDAWVVAALPDGFAVPNEEVPIVAHLSQSNPDGTVQISRNLIVLPNRDEAPPTPVFGVDFETFLLDDSDPCPGPGFYLRATVLQGSSDDSGELAGYGLFELTEAGAAPLAFLPPSDIDGPVSFSRFLARDRPSAEGRCFGVAAVDFALNLSAFEDEFCLIDEARPDAGTPESGTLEVGSMDLGGTEDGGGLRSPDGGRPASPDGGAGASAGLDEVESGCRCAVPIGKAPPLLGSLYALLAIAMLTSRKVLRSGRERPRSSL